MSNFKRHLALSLSTLLLAASLAACSPSAPNAETFEPDQNIVKIGEAADGPHAAKDRKLAKRVVSENATGTVSIVEIDFGNTSVGDFSAPARGLLVAPKNFDGKSPLVVLSHLRAPNCSENTFAYPCPAKTTEYRFDRGMTYFAETLAETGYTVIIPDLGGVYIGWDIKAPYDQHEMWKDIVSKFVSNLKSDVAGQTNTFGLKTLPTPDLSNVGLFLHSRSGAAVIPAAEVFGKGNIKGIFAYGPSYDTQELENISPAPQDIPYLAVVGESDADVGPSANLWISHYLPQKRKHTISVVAVPGFGHMLINQEAEKYQIDDRIGCDEADCPDATAHQKLVKEIGLEWFNATLRGKETNLPLDKVEALPDSVAGLPARWLAATPNALRSLSPTDFKPAKDGSATICVHTDPMNPNKPENACPMPELGIVLGLTEVNYFTEAVAETSVKGAHGMALHVSPTGSYGDAGTGLDITLTLDNGKEEKLRVSPQHPALINRETDTDNGTYQLGTIRLTLPASVTDATITRIHLKTDNHPVQLRTVDFF
ncbi:alpha/beta hydrolase [Gleimia coleocanis]|nr:alpha/beta hydrolase [Gleimia coleocanis]